MRSINPKGIENSLHGKRVREFCRDSQGILWIGTEDGGLNRFNLKTKDFSFFAPSAGFTNIHGLCLVDDKLWVGTFSKGLKVIDTRSGVVLKTYQKNDSPRSLIDNSILQSVKQLQVIFIWELCLGWYDTISNRMTLIAYRN